MEKTVRILKNNKCLKLICGAGNEDVNEIEKLAFVFSKAGFNMIDVSAKIDVINAAKNGIKKAGKEHDVLLCVSVGIQDDIHLSKAFINKPKCVNCAKCLEICPQNAILFQGDSVYIEEKKCIGCSKCIERCPENAIVLEHKSKTPYIMLLPLIAEGIDCVEFHCSSSDIDKIIDSFNKIKLIYSGVLSVCFDRSKLGDDILIELISKMSESVDFLIFQADGNPMSGGVDDFKSTLQSVAFAEIIRNKNLPVYLILSGGTNSKTSALAKQCGISIDGVALGSFARKLVREYISVDNFFENEDAQNKAINSALELYNKICENF